MQLPAGLLGMAEVAINGAVRADPAFQLRLAPFIDKTLRIEMPDLALGIDLVITGQGFLVQSAGPERAAACVRGGPADLLHAVMTGEIAGRIDFTGDPVFARDLLSVLRDLDIDPEEWLAQRLGDVTAHRIGQTLRGAGHWLRRSLLTLERDATEYLVHESQDLVSRHEVKQWTGQVDDLRNDVERLAVRVRALAGRMGRKP